MENCKHRPRESAFRVAFSRKDTEFTCSKCGHKIVCSEKTVLSRVISVLSYLILLGILGWGLGAFTGNLYNDLSRNIMRITIGLALMINSLICMPIIEKYFILFAEADGHEIGDTLREKKTH